MSKSDYLIILLAFLPLFIIGITLIITGIKGC